MLAISKEVLISELETAQKYIVTWIDRCKGEVPGYDTPVTSDQIAEQAEVFVRELCAELRIIGGKCDLLSEVILEGFVQK
jgi:hypothetical protein